MQITNTVNMPQQKPKPGEVAVQVLGVSDQHITAMLASSQEAYPVSLLDGMKENSPFRSGHTGRSCLCPHKHPFPQLRCSVADCKGA